MFVHSQTELILVEVIDRVKVPQECITNQEEILVLTRKSALVNHEVTFVVVGFIKILIGLELEDIVTHLEANGFDFLGD